MKETRLDGFDIADDEVDPTEARFRALEQRIVQLALEDYRAKQAIMILTDEVDRLKHGTH